MEEPEDHKTDEQRETMPEHAQIETKETEEEHKEKVNEEHLKEDKEEEEVEEEEEEVDGLKETALLEEIPEVGYDEDEAKEDGKEFGESQPPAEPVETEVSSVPGILTFLYWFSRTSIKTVAKQNANFFITSFFM